MNSASTGTAIAIANRIAHKVARAYELMLDAAHEVPAPPAAQPAEPAV
jgi:hypothetical protein